MVLGLLLCSEAMARMWKTVSCVQVSLELSSESTSSCLSTSTSLGQFYILVFSYCAVSQKHAPQSSHEKAVCPSVKHMICDKTKESSVHILTPHKRSVTLVLWQEEWLVGATPSTWNFGSNWPNCSENADFQLPIFNRYLIVAPQP